MKAAAAAAVEDNEVAGLLVGRFDGVPREGGGEGAATGNGRRSGDLFSGHGQSTPFSRKRSLRLSKPLFIEIEDKASEPPLVRPRSGRQSRRDGDGDGAGEDESSGELTGGGECLCSACLCSCCILYVVQYLRDTF